ncbi:hypothetical protein ACFXI6_14145 [Streptomyces mirabilis]|uniref:hypothetical protein n=1 Tax=Streptomyces mirabilis TaxID=68239 RepID=UPI0036B2DD39
MSIYRPARVLWNLSDSGTPKSLNGAGSANSGAINLISISDVWLAVTVVGTPTGTTPTLDVGLDVQDPDGNWYPTVAKITQLTTTAGRGSAYIGLHMPNVASTSAALVLPSYGRVTWTLGGTNPVYPQTSIALMGR